MTGAEKAEGRIISMNVYIRLTPPAVTEIGETDAAMEIGHGLIRESLLLLKTAGEREGFKVHMQINQTVY